MKDPFQFLVDGVKEFAHGVEDAQKAKVRFMRSEMKRGGSRIRRQFIRTDLSGLPGIKGGVFRQGKNVFSFIKAGDTTDEPMLFIGINRALRVHEEGHTFTPTKGEWLFLRKGKRGHKEVFAKVKQVVIPKRTHFRQTVKSMAPDEMERAAKEGARGIALAIQRRMDRVIKAL